MASTLQARMARITVTVGGPDTSDSTTASLGPGESVVTPSSSSASGANGSTTYVWTGNRTMIRISMGGNQFNTAEVQVFGISPVTMNALSRLWLTPLNVRPQDTVLIEVLDGGQYVPLFFGSITWCAPRGNSMPQVGLVITANASMALAQTAVPPYSAAGTLALNDVLTNILAASKFTLTASSALPAYTITNPRASGSVQDQIVSILRGFPDVAYDFYLQQLRVRPVGVPLNADTILIGPTTGMMGSPEYSTSGVMVDTLFNPRIILGSAITLDTVFAYATQATWTVAACEHDLEANVPNGRWTSRVVAQGCANPNGTGTAS